MAEIIEGHILCRNPATGTVVDRIPCTPLPEITEGVRRARVAGRAWASLPLTERMGVIRDVKARLLDRAEALVAVLGEEIGKPPAEAWTSEVLTAGELFDHWLGAIEDELADIPVDLNPVNYPGKELWLRVRPRGVIAMIMPWNYPVHLPLRTIVPALLAGNAVAWKPSEHSARAGRLLGDILSGALPADLLFTIQGGARQGSALIEAGVDRLVFTGSVATGRVVAERAARQLVGCELELGSKDAAVVLHDANLERAVEGIAWGAFHNAGQDCASVERCYVDRRIYEEFVKRLVARTATLRSGTDVGPLIDEAALRRVETQVADAVAAGAVVRTGGERIGEGYGYRPTVVTDVPEDATLMTEETFGPVLPVAPFDDEAEVVERVNRSPFGLTASVWSRDIPRAERLAARLDVGVLYVNNCCFTGPMGGAAWVGRKASGGGVTGSRFGLHALTTPQTVCVDRSGGARELWWYPYSEALSGMARGLVELSRPGGSRLSGASLAVRGLFNRWK